MIIWCGGFGTCGRWTQIYNFHSHGLKQNLIKSNVSAVVTFQLPLICHNYCHHPIGMIDCSTSPLCQGRRETKHIEARIKMSLPSKNLGICNLLCFTVFTRA